MRARTPWFSAARLGAAEIATVEPVPGGTNGAVADSAAADAPSSGRRP